MHHCLLVVEPSLDPEQPPAVHLALSVRYELATTVLAENGWHLRGSWLPRSWGRLARVDLVTPQP